ncbi:uncharacterized protein LOC119014053 isoform X2 [Acanthopagrus latus]|uniref:uncharacterized protein LOC119014053 isoform X2 n=1 Tax=Acanthopagrus latus TaxID=8177 RepID=UPI00187BC669|nr:uncharacterized protein LOC119014053 isoform X2 [Acanthopagrus latus]
MQLMMFLVFVCVGTFPAVISECRFMMKGGDDLILQCQAADFDLSDNPLDVTRPDLKHQGKDVVHAYRHQHDFLTDQMDQYKGRTTLNREDLKNGTITLRISSVGPSDSGQYRIFVPGLFVHYITVEQQNSTKTDNSSTAAPPVTDVTEPDNPGAGNTTDGNVGVAAVVVVVVVAVVVLLNLRQIKKKKKLSGPTGPEAEQNSNGLEMGTLMTPETNNSHSTAQNGLMTLTTVSELEDMC